MNHLGSTGARPITGIDVATRNWTGLYTSVEGHPGCEETRDHKKETQIDLVEIEKKSNIAGFGYIADNSDVKIRAQS
jgi:hypothetical protein